MRRIAICCFVWLLVLLPSASRAQGPPGSELLQACGAAEKQSDGIKISDEEAIGSIYCIGYISGFLDSLALSSAASDGGQKICLPQRGITNDQAVRVLVKFLRENPQTLHESGRMSLYIALARTFPCR
jgi:hypothetical protein